jgi:hypothetical protein
MKQSKIEKIVTILGIFTPVAIKKDPEMCKELLSAVKYLIETTDNPPQKILQEIIYVHHQLYKS